MRGQQARGSVLWIRDDDERCDDAGEAESQEEGRYEMNRLRKFWIAGGETGFTLIELLVVVAIIGILAALAIPQVAGAINNSRKQSVISEGSQFQMALARYATDCNDYPGGGFGEPTTGAPTVTVSNVVYNSNATQANVGSSSGLCQAGALTTTTTTTFNSITAYNSTPSTRSFFTALQPYINLPTTSSNNVFSAIGYIYCPATLSSPGPSATVQPATGSSVSFFCSSLSPPNVTGYVLVLVGNNSPQTVVTVTPNQITTTP